MKTPLETRGSRANDGRSARLSKEQPDDTHTHRIAHPPRVRPPPAARRRTAVRAAGPAVTSGPGRNSSPAAHSGENPLSPAINASAHGYQRVSAFPLTGGSAAPTEGKTIRKGN